MKRGFYRTIAIDNIKNNRRFFIPHILTGAGLLACFFITRTLAADKRIAALHGGDYVSVFMGMGMTIVALLSIILILYTNSFLMKQRKQTYGLYNVLGMEKRHIGRVLLYESVISGVISIIAGLILGVLFYKICALIICMLLKADIIIGFYFITVPNLTFAGSFFAFIYILTYIINIISIKRLKPVELLSGTKSGEKEPKVRFILLIIGLISLSFGYGIAVTVKNPLQAMLLFFLAVILVIIGTYFLFVAGSIFILKALKKNKNFYYNQKHMTAVSGLIYRMKQNAVGLASIAVLATGVLIMISTTVSLYSGMQDTLSNNYPQHYYVSEPTDRSNENKPVTEISHTEITDCIRSAAADYDLSIKDMVWERFLQVSYIYRNGELLTDQSETDYANIATFIFMTKENYQALGHDAPSLSDDEVLICPVMANINTVKLLSDTLTVGGKTYKVAGTLDSFPVAVTSQATLAFGVILPNEESFNTVYEEQRYAYESPSEISNRIAVTFEDPAAACNVGEEFNHTVYEKIQDLLLSKGLIPENINIYTDTLWGAKESVVGMYGTFLFLGILLGMVCLFATALIIYYKQISEGYEDRNRFQIMEKIGMSQKEVKQTITRQILLVFFLPLIVAGIHTCFAFPILTKMLHILLLSSTTLFAVCTIIVYLVFALVYILIYSGTARTYYKIVH